MDPKRFDEFSKGLAAATSRRNLVKGLGGGILGGAFALAGLGRADAKPAKVGICHHTGNRNIPVVYEEVSASTAATLLARGTPSRERSRTVVSAGMRAPRTMPASLLFAMAAAADSPRSTPSIAPIATGASGAPALPSAAAVLKPAPVRSSPEKLAAAPPAMGTPCWTNNRAIPVNVRVADRYRSTVNAAWTTIASPDSAVATRLQAFPPVSAAKKPAWRRATTAQMGPERSRAVLATAFRPTGGGTCIANICPTPCPPGENCVNGIICVAYP